ncbi:ABC transporter permease [Loigolactobacillus iwatensis]|uniref:ABC transporter permease n=1 Tax=Loigolactobacillus iwatensis TaxID=1267156 RepID=UPI000F7E1A0F|nr:ABC transporter permease [Loigolactobacillus iwatensis]
MFKRKSMLAVLTAILAFAGVFFFSQMNRADYQDILDRGGLSTNAYVFKSPKQSSIVALNQTFATQHDLENYQVQYQLPHSSTVYLYGAGNFKTLPLISGRFFNDSDFKSQIPVAVVGKKVAKKLYSPTEQSYLKYGNRYISVIGVVGNRSSSHLDNRIFISTSTKQSLTPTKVNKFRIVIDGKPYLKKRATFQSILAAKTPIHLVPSRTPIVGASWLARYWGYGLAIVLVFILLVGVAELGVIVSRPALVTNVLQATTRWQIFGREWRQFAVSSLGGLLVGGIIGMWRLYISQYTALWWLLLAFYLVTQIYYAGRLYYYLRQQIKSGRD